MSIRAGIPTLEAGGTAALTQQLEPGRYALICFLDSPSDRPHFLDGMLGVVDVGGDGGADAPEADEALSLGKGMQADERAGARQLPRSKAGVDYAPIDDVNKVERRFELR